MRKPSLASVVATAAVLCVACDPGPQEQAVTGPELSIAGGRHVFVTDVISLADGATTGRAVLRRSAVGLATQLHTSRLEPGFAYTGWWFAFDAPEQCSPPACSVEDVLDVLAGGPNPYELTILGPFDGGVADPAGQIAFRGHLAAGDLSTLLIGDGLDHPTTAVVWTILRSHGPAIPGQLEEQLGSVDGGCYPGDPNEGLCEDAQIAVYQ